MNFSADRKQIIALKALQNGIPVKLGTYTYRLFKKGESVKMPSSEEGVLEGSEFWLGLDVTGEGEYLGSDMDLVSFLRKSSELPDEEIISLGFSLAMIKPKREVV